MNFTKFNVDEQLEKSVAAASELFSAGKIFIYPTDTIYGIGGDPFNESSVKRITDIKGRNIAKQFIWLVADIETLFRYTDIEYESHIDFLKNICPAPVTVALNLNAEAKELVGYNSAAFRIPDNLFCSKLLAEIRKPLISTSVNRSGENALNDHEKIEREFGKAVDALFYSSTENIPLASTIIDLKRKKPALIREGTIKFVELLNKFD